MGEISKCFEIKQHNSVQLGAREHIFKNCNIFNVKKMKTQHKICGMQLTSHLEGNLFN